MKSPAFSGPPDFRKNPKETLLTKSLVGISQVIYLIHLGGREGGRSGEGWVWRVVTKRNWTLHAHMTLQGPAASFPCFCPGWLLSLSTLRHVPDLWHTPAAHIDGAFSIRSRLSTSGGHQNPSGPPASCQFLEMLRELRKKMMLQ